MITDLSKTSKYISNWIKTYANDAGIKALIVGLSGGIDSALIALLCKNTMIPTICVTMPCCSDVDTMDRANNFAIDFGLKTLNVYLETAYQSIRDQCGGGGYDRYFGAPNTLADHKTKGTLKSCLRAPVLSYMANAHRGLVVGTGNRSEDNLIRYYNKFGDGCADISPIGDLFKSEVYNLFAHVTINNGANSLMPESAMWIYNAKPTADLWGKHEKQTDEEELGITYDEIEWADRENTKNDIIVDNADPVRHREWARYTTRQREVIAKIHQMEKMSRHKHNPNLPICKLRHLEGLVR
jgi:NAD+ synthase